MRQPAAGDGENGNSDISPNAIENDAHASTEMSANENLSPPAGTDGAPTSSSPKKRRKVNHGEFPCLVFSFLVP